MSRSIGITTADELIEGLARYFGVEKHLWRDPDGSLGYIKHDEPFCTFFSFKCKLRFNPADDTQDIEFFDDIKKSDAIEDLIATYKDQLTKLEKIVHKLQQENSELEKYKAYYEAAYELRHGRVREVSA